MALVHKYYLDGVVMEIHKRKSSYATISYKTESPSEIDMKNFITYDQLWKYLESDFNINLDLMTN